MQNMVTDEGQNKNTHEYHSGFPGWPTFLLITELRQIISN